MSVRRNHSRNKNRLPFIFYSLSLSLCIVLLLFNLFKIPPEVKAVAGTATFSGTTASLTGTATAQQFIDTANSSYFLDPANTGNSLNVAGSINALSTVTGSQFNGSGAGLTGTAASLTAANVTSLAGTWDGISYFRSNKGASSYVGGQNTYALEAYSSDAGAAGMSFHRGGYYAVNMGLDPDNVMRIGGWSAASNRWQLDMSGNETLAGTVTSTQFNGSGAGLTGTAASLTAGAANSVAWGNVTSKPSNLTYWSSWYGAMYIDAGNACAIGGGSAGIIIFNTSCSYHIRYDSGAPGMFMSSSGGWIGAYNNGTIAGSSAWNNWSDIRLKKNIASLNNPLDIINHLNGISFYWKDPKADQRIQYGFVAQDVEKILPSIVTDLKNDKGNYKGLASSEIIPFLVEGIKEQQKEIEDLKHQIDDLKKEIGDLKK